MLRTLRPLHTTAKVTTLKRRSIMSDAVYKVVSTESAPAAVGPYVQATQAGPLTFLSGCIGLDPKTMKVVEGGVEAQTTQVLKNLSEVVKASGNSLGNVVKATVFLKDLGDFAKVNKLYADHFAPNKPARSCVEVAALPLGVLVEIEAIVYNDGSKL